MTTEKISPDEWNIACAVEEFWAREKYFPATKIIAELTNLDLVTVDEILHSPRLQKRFTLLGIDEKVTPVGKTGKNDSRLSDKQLAVAMTLLNPMDQRSLGAKLKSLGVLPATYHGWTKSKNFSEFMASQAEEMFGSGMPIAHASLLKKVIEGDVRAIKLYYEMSGRYSRQNDQSNQNFTLLVHKLIEILQRHISDPIVLQELAEEIKGITNPTPAPVRGELIA